MDKEDIVKMAREVGIPTGRIGGYDKELKRFADLVAAAVAEPEQEPVAFINVEKQKLEWAKLTSWHTPTIVNLPKIPLYTAPQKKEWIGLTDEELHLKAAAYANKRKETYLDYVKKEERLSKEMIEWIWVAHYEGYRDAVQEQDHG